MNVPVGPTTKGGVGAALLAFIGAAVTYLTGDHTAQSVTAVELAGGGLTIVLVTMAGRYAQSLLKPLGTALADPPLPAGLDPAAGGAETDSAITGSGD